MNPKLTLLFAGGLTAFVLVVVGAVAGRAAAQDANGSQTPTVVDASIQQQLDQRDAAYQETIDQANKQLEDAYQQIVQIVRYPTRQSTYRFHFLGLDQLILQLDPLCFGLLTCGNIFG